MKRDLLKVCVFVSLSIFAVRTHAAGDVVECDCYMEYQNIEMEAKAYASQASRDASVTEFTDAQRLEIQEATNLIAER